MSSMSPVFQADVGYLSTSSGCAARRRSRQRSTSMSAATIVRVLWLQTMTQAFVGGLTSLTEAASNEASSSSSSSCPPACFCNAPSRIVYCSRRGLTAVPGGIASNSLQLNLNGNVFASSTLRRGNFSGLSSLEHLYLSECGIERLAVGTVCVCVKYMFCVFSTSKLFIFNFCSF